jgi:hypothetical protein
MTGRGNGGMTVKSKGGKTGKGGERMSGNGKGVRQRRLSLFGFDFLVSARGGFDSVDVNGGKTARRCFAIVAGLRAAQRTGQR